MAEAVADRLLRSNVCNEKGELATPLGRPLTPHQRCRRQNRALTLLLSKPFQHKCPQRLALLEVAPPGNRLSFRTSPAIPHGFQTCVSVFHSLHSWEGRFRPKYAVH